MMGLELGLLTHLDAQIASSKHLLEIVLAQGEAIKLRDAQTVVGLTAELQNELHRRAALDHDRAALLRDAGAMLGRPAAEVTLEAVCDVVSPGAAENARERSGQLRDLLAEVSREHALNRALMRQELAFLSHLTRLLGDDPEPGYAPPAAAARPATAHRMLDLEA